MQEQYSFESLVKQRSQEDTVILLGFNFGYQDMVLNMVCRLNQLHINNYVIAAFEDEAMAFCQKEVLPCFRARSPAGSAIGGEQQKQKQQLAANVKARLKGTATEAVLFGSTDFRALTKVKSQQVLRILKLGIDVVWTDVDIFWKVNPIPPMLEEMGDEALIGIQSNAPQEEEAETGMRRINSGLYYVKSTTESVEAFSQIVDHASKSRLSEQPSFYTILCGDTREYVTGKSTCFNPSIPIKTQLLSRKRFPNGAMKDVLKGVTPNTQDDVAIAHFNWVEGHANKVARFHQAQMWQLTDKEECLYYTPVAKDAS